MSNYTQEELQGMSRVQLRRAAIEVLKIDNKEASNTKSGDLIGRIVQLDADGGEEKTTAPKRTRRSRKAAPKDETTTSHEEAAPKTKRASTNGVGKLVDAVGKAVDETKEELGAKVEDVLDNQDRIMKQQFLLFGLLCDIYKAVDEPDALEERLVELDEEWDKQGND